MLKPAMSYVFYEISLFFSPCRSVTLQRKRKKPLPQAGFLSVRKLDTARDDLFRCCPSQSTRSDASLPLTVIGKHTICVRHRTLKSSTATELGTVVTWAAAHKSALTGGLVGFLSVCWWALNMFQMCWPHKTATYHRLGKNRSKTVFPHPYGNAPGLPGWVTPEVLKPIGCQSWAWTREQLVELSSRALSHLSSPGYLCPGVRSLPDPYSLGFKLLLCSGSPQGGSCAWFPNQSAPFGQVPKTCCRSSLSTVKPPETPRRTNTARPSVCLGSPVRGLK